eukprot:CAMPEP_0179003748 /NCGR_PEP_ID=MMETSP0795-20121207/12880_1 /TAXON_ID=88552 /ORGANISM="Amoebophrya sp., Strain Ameob2" /LENGTH=174 /DNA_ID=CAMNT_0020697851 /DNA_START=216 /DNA_END=741 /DNA_ORIENTATION=-
MPENQASTFLEEDARLVSVGAARPSIFLFLRNKSKTKSKNKRNWYGTTTTDKISVYERMLSQHSVGQRFEPADALVPGTSGVPGIVAGSRTGADHGKSNADLTPEFLSERSNALENTLVQVDEAVEQARVSKTKAVEARAVAETVYAETRKMMENFVEEWNRKSQSAATGASQR